MGLGVSLVSRPNVLMISKAFQQKASGAGQLPPNQQGPPPQQSITPRPPQAPTTSGGEPLRSAREKNATKALLPAAFSGLGGPKAATPGCALSRGPEGCPPGAPLPPLWSSPSATAAVAGAHHQDQDRNRKHKSFSLNEELLSKNAQLSEKNAELCREVEEKLRRIQMLEQQNLHLHCRVLKEAGKSQELLRENQELREQLDRELMRIIRGQI
ncbi:uncharacterized protein LOC117657266 isoform X3 [Pantherophis guttatus]|uniref:Uncharacterized protein LOC117657266 isoform X3 n=1 Tax=Pantherophis guttatus TaxID=94885 RepID=A0ABM3Z1L4_PANGU|nr:uncharacterized protein LOC117657266 isoform X3 [Pantherophis guttatus]